MHLFSMYSIGLIGGQRPVSTSLHPLPYFDPPPLPISRERELSRYTHLPGCVTIPTITSGFGQKVKPLGGNIGGQNQVSTSLHPPYFDPPISRERELSQWFNPRGITRYYKKDRTRRLSTCLSVFVAAQKSVYALIWRV